MRVVSGWRPLVLCPLLVAALSASPLSAEEDARTLRFLAHAITQPTKSEASSQNLHQPTLASHEDSPAEPTPSASPPVAPAPSPSVSVEPAPTATTPSPSFPRPGIAASRVAAPLFEPQVTNQTHQALGFYGGNAARSTLNQLPRRAPIQSSSPQRIGPRTKPFQSIHNEPTVSPYLNLYRDESNVESAPNYFAFVRPQLEQLESARVQQREIQRLRGQLQNVSSTVAGPQYRASGMPGTGHAARYMDTAQFYGSMQQ